MNRPPNIWSRYSRRAGFSLVETLVVSGLMAFLVAMLAQAWSGLGRPSAEMLARGRIDQEADLALASLASDLGGSLVTPAGSAGTWSSNPFVGRLQPSQSQLWLCFDGGPKPNGVADWGAPDIVIVYELQGNRLTRSDQSAGTRFTVARDMSKFEVIDLGGRVQIKLTFSYRKVTKTYTLIARNP